MAYTTINKSSLHMNTKLYSGNYSTNAITGVGFQPDLIWIKEKSSTSSHRLFDAIRGVGKGLSSDNTGAENFIAQLLTSFDTDGFTVGADNGVNENSQTYASWNWKANGSSSSNSNGDITSTVSANTTAGFSIVKYTGNSGGSGYSATIGHGLGVKPSCMIIKNLSTTSNWAVYHKSLNGGTNPEVKYLEFNSNGQLDDAGIFYDTAPTNSVFTVGTSDKTNTVNENYIAYCFTEKKGYSKFGSYTGNGNADGTFVYTGFKPAFIIIKRTDASGDWQLVDNKRDIDNPTNKTLFPNLDNAEDAGDRCDMVSNGFKILSSTGTWNASGATYIYMAFGQSLVGSNNVPCTAR